MTDNTPAGTAPAPSALGDSTRFVRRLLGNKVALGCSIFLAIVVVIAVTAPLALPHVATENAGDLLAAKQGPSARHPLGTDTLGRDVLDRLLVGSRVTVVGVAEAMIVILALGIPFGLVAGLVGGALDRAVAWISELTFSMPGIIIILVVLSVFPQSMSAAMVTFGVLSAPGLMRVVRAAVLPVKEEPYIEAAKVAGLSPLSIMVRHVLPRIAGPIIVQASLLAAAALLVQSGLAFLDLVVAAPAPSWGGMITDGLSVIIQEPWLIWPPGIAIASTVLALGLLGDAVRDATTQSWSPRAGATDRRLARRSAAAAVGTAAPRPEALLSLQGLSIEFDTPLSGPVQIVEDISFDVRPGETVGLVGESGSGKTVTGMSVLGLLPSGLRVTAGRILFDGHDLQGMSDTELGRLRGKEIGFISQEPTISLTPGFRVGWQLAEVVRRHDSTLTRKEVTHRVDELLGSVRLPDPAGVRRRYPHELSGGMAQRVVLARALAGGPRLLIADEPTTALDVTVQAEILDLLRGLQRDRGMAVLLVTHDWGVVADICDRAVVMYAGQVVEHAALWPILERPLHPYTAALLASNPHHVAEGTLLPTIPGAVPRPGAWPAGCHFGPRCELSTTRCGGQPVALAAATANRETRCIHFDKLTEAR